ncbi:VSP [Giardia duodenalis]|uniref:VSP n=1 Tax=Giardia intestinalis (strain ATCC 50803 / WB clone C6) TaxID=184922 RepID=A8BSC1_GIAIC|nr:VSP [Giardia intestinalis]KAE8304683.1 VSP [Giardia intestinalis]|eukprot:XP_001705078.1 VSP [Giardia lamblia ATCC 50803]
MFQLIPLFVASALMAACQPDGNHTATCAQNKCETVGATEICTQCRAGGVPVDGFCWPPGSPQAAAAGCTEEDGATLDKTATTCGKCGDGYFLFMGGCYKVGQDPGSEICTKASDGVCTTCKTDNGLFKNPATAPKPGSECILCSDIKGADGYTGVENCAQCTKSDSNKGAATCTECQDGYYKDAKGACVQCQGNCATCETSATQCTSCKAGFYLKDGNSCVAEGECTNTVYPDPESGKCKACSTITDCTECSFDKATGKPQCTACGSQKTPRTTLDGTSTCVDKTLDGCKGADGALFMKDDTTCALCGDASPGAGANDKGIAGCKTCTKQQSQKPECTSCLDGYFFEQSSKTCSACASNCATCTSADVSTCTECLPGYFLKTEGETKCAACDSTPDGGREGCSLCSSNGGFKCTECKPNYKKQSNGGAGDDYTCTKTCEDETACGGTAGACDAIVVGNDGSMLSYCSKCVGAGYGPINGKCTNALAGNTCADGVCTRCTNNYFLYMGGCYDVSKAPGNLMCSAAPSGFCTTPVGRYFKIPGDSAAQQSVLACGNPVGATAGDKAYVGVLDCTACAAPQAPAANAMAAAVCSACDKTKKPNKDGSGCTLCAVGGCKSCAIDGMCEVCAEDNKKPNMAGSTCYVCPAQGCSHCSADNKCEACTNKDQRPSLDGTQCIVCDIERCMRCSAEGVCGECEEGYVPRDGMCVSSGTNRSGLSTGAIAGISVAVVVVVGGLVGFLCWWFICRGKA